MKKLKYIFATGVVSTLGMLNVFAATSSISAAKQVEVGHSVTGKVTINAAAWNIRINGTGNTNGCSAGPFVGDSGTGKNTTKTFTVSCTANSTGIIKISYSGDIADASGTTKDVSGSTTVTVVAARPKSTNNYLKSLSVEGATISPEFNKDTLDYTVQLEPGTEKIVINAEKEDGYASLSGTGEQTVVEGENKFDINVISETGSTRTYHLTVVVKEYAPIIVKVNGKEYSIVRKAQELTKPESFTETTVQIGEETVPAFYNEVTKKTLVGLKDEDGKVLLYEYNDGKYSRYYEFNFKQITLNVIKMDTKLLPKGYSKYTEKVGEEELEVYKYSKNSKYAIVYALDVTTGEKKLYQIDLKNNSVQVFNDELIKTLEDNNKKSLLVFAIAGGVIFLEFLIIIASRKKRKKILNRIKNDKMEKVKEKAIQDAKEETIAIDLEEIKEADKKEDKPIEEKPKKSKKKKKSE